jgi:hypothetical protein
MLTTAIKLALVTTLFVLIAPSADAQRVHPRCTKSKDKVKCTCFRDNGGHIVNSPGGSRRAVIRSLADTDRYLECMRHNGRPNG